MKRKLSAGLALLLLSTAIALAAAEGGLRLAQRLGLASGYFRALNSAYTPFDVMTGDGLYYAHPYISYDMKPGYTMPGVTINSLGFRGAEFTRRKPPGRFRVVALGGSTTYGIQLRDEETYPYRLQAELRRQLGTDTIDVINAGLVSATTAESLPRFLLRIVPLEPDLVVFYEGYNDLPPRMFSGYSDDYYHFRKSPQNRFSVLSNLLVYRAAAAGARAGLHYPNVDLLSDTWKLENLPAEDGERIRNFEGTSAAVYERNLDYIITVATARKIGIVLSTFAFNDDAPNWNDYMPDILWSRGIGQNNDVVRGLAATHGLPLVDFYAYGLGHRGIFSDSIHMSAPGNAEMARVFAETLVPYIRGHWHESSPGESTLD